MQTMNRFFLTLIRNFLPFFFLLCAVSLSSPYFLPFICLRPFRTSLYCSYPPCSSSFSPDLCTSFLLSIFFSVFYYFLSSLAFFLFLILYSHLLILLHFFFLLLYQYIRTVFYCSLSFSNSAQHFPYFSPFSVISPHCPLTSSLSAHFLPLNKQFGVSGRP
jgi:hypothetical protein